MNILIIGGTRNLGHFLTLRLLAEGHHVTLLNRGQTPDDLPAGVTRLRADRSDLAQLKQALAGRSFEVVVDTTLYTGPDARNTVDLLAGRVGHYVFISTGQVYLVRRGVNRPFKEEDYAGPVMDAPSPENKADYQDWLYGVDKRAAEDVLAAAWAERRFPFVSLRLPMVHSERDHHSRIYGYLLRLRDGGPILLPSGPRLAVRHVYVGDVVAAILKVLQPGAWTGQAYNVGQDDTLSLDEFLTRLAELSGCPLNTITVERAALEAADLLPGCSPFSSLWMSELDNRRGKAEAGFTYTPMPVYLQKLVDYLQSSPPPLPLNYDRRAKELELVQR
jgi:nucleoside-diphosphate-sugar epimerase